MDFSDEFLLRLMTEEDIEHARQLVTPVERSVMFALRAGADVKPAQIVETFGTDQDVAERLLKRLKARQ